MGDAIGAAAWGRCEVEKMGSLQGSSSEPMSGLGLGNAVLGFDIQKPGLCEGILGQKSILLSRLRCADT